MFDTLNTTVIAEAEIASAIGEELDRQQTQIELIASENIVSPDAMAAQGSVLTNQYAKEYPGKRYCGGCAFVERAVVLALSRPGDQMLGLSLADGGHLTHGPPETMAGKRFDVVPPEVDPECHLIDMEKVREKVLETKPTLIVVRASAYSRKIDFAGFCKIADEVGAYVLVDMADCAGLIAGGQSPDPVPHAHGTAAVSAPCAAVPICGQ